jgi:hypothetical protein
VIDPVACRFEYESRSDDGNRRPPLWSWQVTPADAGSELTVTWAVCPRTWDDGCSALASAGAR